MPRRYIPQVGLIHGSTYHGTTKGIVMKIEKIALLALLLTVLGVWAYNPPVDRQADVAAGIVQEIGRAHV